MKNIYKRICSSYFKIILIFLLGFSMAANAQESMRTNLYVVDASGTTLVDGNLTNYNNIYSNTVDINDGWKMTNPGINFGIIRDGNNLVVERRSIIHFSDTTFFRMWNLPQYHYQLRFVLTNLDHPGLRAVIKDSYLNTETPVDLNDTTYYDFRVDGNAASSDQMRFQLVYGKAVPVNAEVNFAGIKAKRKDKNVLLEFEVANEVYMSSYTIEHSVDGLNFHGLYEFSADNSQTNRSYSYLDSAAVCTDNFYRIKAISMAGKIQYSPVAKSGILVATAEITIYPNPVENKTVQLQLNKLPLGKYSISLLNNSGNSQSLSSIQVVSGQVNCSVNLPRQLAPGIYRLAFDGPDKLRMTKLIVVL